MSVEENCVSDSIQPGAKFAVFPSIAKGSVNITYQVADPESKPEINIYDAAGRLIKKFNNITIQPFNQVTWDCRDNNGRHLDNGVYFVKLETQHDGQVCKVILVNSN